MKKHVALTILLAFLVLMFQSSGTFAAEPQYYVIGLHPVEADRGVRSDECVGKWNEPIPGLMGTTEGFKGNKSLAPLTPIIFPKEQLGKVIPARQQLTLFGCGNGYIPSVPLDTTQALGILCRESLAPEIKLFLSDAPYAPSVKEQAQERFVREIRTGLSTGTKVVIGGIAVAVIIALVKAFQKSAGSDHGPGKPPPIQ
jgi:hypothetical protein